MIDRTKLESLLGGNKKTVERFLDIFKSLTPKQLRMLKSDISNKNWDKASITAHAIKSQCKYLGLDDIAQRASEIEQLTEERKQLPLIPGLAVLLQAKILNIIEKELV